MTDKYLDSAKEIAAIAKKRDKMRLMRKGYSTGKDLDMDSAFENANALLDSLGNTEKSSHIQKGYVAKVANFLMTEGAKNDYLGAVVKGAEVYDKFGLGNRLSVKRRLSKAFKKNPENYHAKAVTEFFERNPEEDRLKNLEKK